MSTVRPTFKVMKNGYDRFAVDEAVEKLASEIDVLKEQLKANEKETASLREKMSELKLQYSKMEKTLAAEKNAADNLTRLSLKEANEIIVNAQNNADMIIGESLKTARSVLRDLAELYSEADIVRMDTKEKLSDLAAELDEIRLPRMPDIEWLKEAERKMR